MHALADRWRNWRRELSGWNLAALGLGLPLGLPLLLILVEAGQAEPRIWQRLWATRLPQLLQSSLLLAGGVGLVTLVLGVGSAWLITRHDFYGRNVWEWLLAAPLAVPPYILAMVYSDRFPQVFGSYLATVGVLSLATYPYVYLMTRAALLQFNTTYEEAARIAGASRAEVVRRVVLPSIRPGVAAGLFLAMTYCLADFGAVSIMGYPTFTRAIHLEWRQIALIESASALAIVLVLLCAAFFLTERYFRRQARFYQTTGTLRRRQPQPLAIPGTITAWLFCSVLFVLGFAFVCYRLIEGSISGIAEAGLEKGLLDGALVSLQLALLAACIGTVAAFLIGYAAVRLRSWSGTLSLRICYAGYVLPGPIVAVGVIILFQSSWLYSTMGILIFAYLVRFLPQALQASETMLHQLTPGLEEAGRSCGASRWHVLRRITLPLVRPGLLVGWVLIFLATLKELPATLLLRPLGYDTLAVRVWQQTSEELFEFAAPPALLLILLSLPLVAFLLSRDLSQSGQSVKTLT